MVVFLLVLALSIHLFLQAGKSYPNKHRPTAWCQSTTASNPEAVGVRAEAEHPKVGIRSHKAGFSHPRCCTHLVRMLSYAGMGQQKTFTHPLPHPACRKASPAGQLEALHPSPSGRAQRFTKEKSSRVSCIWMTSRWATVVAPGYEDCSPQWTWQGELAPDSIPLAQHHLLCVGKHQQHLSRFSVAITIALGPGSPLIN